VSANRLFLVCRHHQNPEDAFCVGERAGNDAQYVAPRLKGIDDWYAKHMGCGRGLDHFQVGYSRTQDWDVPQPAEKSVAGTVRLELVKGGSDAAH